MNVIQMFPHHLAALEMDAVLEASEAVAIAAEAVSKAALASVQVVGELQEARRVLRELGVIAVPLVEIDPDRAVVHFIGFDDLPVCGAPRGDGSSSRADVTCDLCQGTTAYRACSSERAR